MPQENLNSSRVSGCLVRLFWMGVGNLILVLLAIGIAHHNAGFTLTARDIFFWGTVSCLLAVRYVDIRYLAGETADSQPASMSDWRRYAITIAVVSLAIWLGAHSLS